ncbi:hypothetical protein NDU88_003970 [Pleurodeles waltl]|uniref:Uncharacterized protein n=1 Tax=Pleurodeles waltl TaxID=8319 RepID=A0AAV7L023_PLEWA|nr:hypothetical protein NDU88_003970 [Pleurodeles waltl]
MGFSDSLSACPPPPIPKHGKSRARFVGLAETQDCQETLQLALDPHQPSFRAPQDSGTGAGEGSDAGTRDLFADNGGVNRERYRGRSRSGDLRIPVLRSRGLWRDPGPQFPALNGHGIALEGARSEAGTALYCCAPPSPARYPAAGMRPMPGNGAALFCASHASYALLPGAAPECSRLIGGDGDTRRQVGSQELRRTSEAAALLRGLIPLKDITSCPSGPTACPDTYYVGPSSGVRYGSYPPREISGFQSRVMGLQQRVTMVKAQAATSQDQDQKLAFLQSKLTYLEDRSRRDNIQFLGFPGAIKGEDMHLFLWETLPKLMGITFNPPLEFHRAHRLGPKRTGATARPARS